MVSADLFAAEKVALARAMAVLEANSLEAEDYRQALQGLVEHYRRLMRETHRLIRHGDRSEAELNAVNVKLKQLSAELDYKARHDSLTNTLNRSAVFELAQHYLSQGSLSLIILDIDFFKRINDSFGHPVGDAVLQELVERLSAILGDKGNIGRVGGEEFTILLPQTALPEAISVAESIRKDIADRAFSCLPTHTVTASFGVGWHAPGTDIEQAYSDTDAALYQAKYGGRNQVQVAACSTSA